MNLQKNIRRILKEEVFESDESRQERKFTKLLNNIEEYINSNSYNSVVRVMVDYDEVMDDVIVNIFFDAEHAVKLGGGINSVIKRSGKKIMEDLSVFPFDFKYYTHFEKPQLNESIRRILREEKDQTKLIKGIIESSDIFDYKHFCGFDIITPEERSDQYNFLNKDRIPYLIKVYFVGGPNSEVWPRTQAIRNKELDLMEELHEYIKSFVPFNIEMMGSHVNSCDGYDKLMKRKYTTDDLQESIRKVLKEETEGIDSFLDEINSKHNMSDELKDFVKQFIEESDCKRINFSRFKMGVMGLALESGVLINSVALNHPLPFLLFLIFHEVAHQYQFKKYGEDVMYDCYLGEISERDAAEFMKHTEEVADDFASRKIRQLQKLNLIGPYTPPQMYKNVPIQQITMMINNYREDMRRKNIDSPKKVSEYFYNMVKSEL
jgi:hypothetical protein